MGRMSIILNSADVLPEAVCRRYQSYASQAAAPYHLYPAVVICIAGSGEALTVSGII